MCSDRFKKNHRAKVEMCGRTFRMKMKQESGFRMQDHESNMHDYCHYIQNISNHGVNAYQYNLIVLLHVDMGRMFQCHSSYQIINIFLCFIGNAHS